MQYIPPIGKMGEAPYIDGNPAQDIEGDAVSAKAWEHPMRELVAGISAGGLAPDGADLQQLARSLFLHAVKGQQFKNSGTANQLRLVPLAGNIAPIFPNSYAQLDGATVSFTPASSNTAAVTADIGSGPAGLLGAKPLVKAGVPLVAGDLQAGVSVQLQFSASNDRWSLLTPFKQSNGAAQLGPIGYQFFPGGLMLQWGSLQAVPAGGSAVVTYPIAFPNARFSFVATANSVLTADVTYVGDVLRVSEVVFNHGSAAQNIFWMAVGF